MIRHQIVCEFVITGAGLHAFSSENFTGHEHPRFHYEPLHKQSAFASDVYAYAIVSLQ
jgi:hypothetical protein